MCTKAITTQKYHYPGRPDDPGQMQTCSTSYFPIDIAAHLIKFTSTMPIIFALDDFLARLSLVCQCAFVFQHLTRGVLAIFWSWRRLARFLIKMGCINFPKHQQIFKCLLMRRFYFCRLAPSGPPQTLHICLDCYIFFCINTSKSCLKSSPQNVYI